MKLADISADTERAFFTCLHLEEPENLEETAPLRNWYEEYKDKGFSVFGVSLDRDKDAWVKAIADDNLTWDHVSDLAYWSNAAAKLYAISSVPSSLLVDKNGKIIAKNKRGDELTKTVGEFFAN